jgi:hypothetical protein
MTFLARVVVAVATGSLLVACGGGGGGNNNQTLKIGQVRVVHVVTDAPTLTARIGTANIATVAYAQASRMTELGRSDYDLDFVYTDPTGDLVTVLDNRELRVEEGRQLTAVAFGTLGQPGYLAIDEAVPDVAAGKTEVHFVQGARGANSVDFYLTAATTDIAGVSPTATVNAGAASSLMTLNAGADQRLRVTAAGSKTAVYDSGPFTLESAVRRLIVLTDYFGPGGPGVRAVIVDNASASTFANEALPAAWRVANLVVDLPAVDVYAGTATPPPAFAAVAEGTQSQARIVTPATFTAIVTPAGAPANSIASSSLALVAGIGRTLVAAGVAAGGRVTLRGVADLARPITGQAQVRVVNGAPAAGTVDLHVLPAGTSPSATSADLAALALQSSGIVALEAGTYDVFFTAASSTTVLTGPVPITVAGSGLYSIYLADLVGGGQPLRVLLADDFVE